MSTSSPQIPGRLLLSLRSSKDTSLQSLPGVGPATANKLKARGITDQLELLLFLPRKYRPTYRFYPGPEMLRQRAEWIEAIGKVTAVIPQSRHSRAPFEIHLDVDGAEFRLLWFRLPYPGFDRKFLVGRHVHFEGKVDHDRMVAQLSHPSVEVLKEAPQSTPAIELQPVYSSMEDVHDSIIPKIIAATAQNLLPHLHEKFSPQILQSYELPSLTEALQLIHVLTPQSDPDTFYQELQRARHRLIFEEFFDLQSALTYRYVAERRGARAPRCSERELGRALFRNLPFNLTDDQKRAIATIANELDSTVPMRRLLQGDVGSGKTVVALLAAAIAVANNIQVAMMAPTDILAHQHLRRVEEFCRDLPIHFASLTASLSTADKRTTLKGLKDGSINLVVGTHSLFQEGVEFQNLGLVIVDEEHKFGVEQRKELTSRGQAPHLLAMTATPIPRTLAHAVFGDRDLTVLKEKPPGRKPIKTVLRDRSRAPRVYDFIRQEVEANDGQAYIVFPLVEANENLANRKSVMEGAQELANGPFAGLKVGILHGRMDASAKADVMQRFASGDLQVLCATTVIEVGVDVPNATIMVIENAELFGLSQLHQLRGRVGRGDRDSLCILLASLGLTEDAHRRLQAMVQTDDGFVLAETDLAIRGPGEFLGMKQAGLPEFRFGDILRDAHWLRIARQEARRQILGDAAR